MTELSEFMLRSVGKSDSMNITDLLLLLVVGYILTVLIEVPILCVGMSSKHRMKDKVISGLLLTAFTYPIVIMVIPAGLYSADITSRWACLGVSETFAPLAEILFFRYLVHQRFMSTLDRDAVAIVVANLASFVAGEAGLSDLIHLLLAHSWCDFSETVAIH